MNTGSRLLLASCIAAWALLSTGCSSGRVSYSIYAGYGSPYYGAGWGYYRPPYYSRPDRPDRPKPPSKPPVQLPERPGLKPPGNIGRPRPLPSRPPSRPSPRPAPATRAPRRLR